ncbi:WRKY transcription factor 81 [Solanum lycopersicum]|uniref:WRKY transcription factor 81 n=1 Tax=Solanum lycopersicum TaxID=4081 RepID=I3NN77_SOLLC|nr:WRKY transcription factor 81 [Solanum lycopersicum]ADZ15316.1 WRKY3 [Solanum lycopersicum]
MDNSSSDLNRAIEGLIRGREFTRRLKQIIKISGGEVENIMAEDLVAKILDSFSETLSVINNSDVVVATAVEVKSPEDYSSGSCKSSDRRGCYKRRKTSESDIKESSDLVDDGHAWRKYGQKQILNSTYPRHYFRCTHKYDQKCQASKQVQKIQDNPQRFRTTYYGHHTCKAFPRVSQIILDSQIDGNSNYISFDQNHTFPSIKQETKEEVVFRFYPKIEDQIQSSSSDYFLPNDHDHDHLTPATFEASGSRMTSPDVISSGVYSSCTTTSNNDNLEIDIDFEEGLWNFDQV